MKTGLHFLAVLFFIGLASVRAATPDFARLESAVRDEMADWGITGIDVAIIDDQQTVYSSRFGEADPAGAFRCGSISKLFNAVAVMQMVEAGKLDLDAPLERYIPELVPVNPFPGSPAMTLRQLLCHRSGIVRESPAGGYLDGTEPGFARMIGSVPQTVLPTAPNAKLRYSNVGPSVAGHMVAKVTSQAFPVYQRERILNPLGMNNSAWLRKDLERQRIVPAYMRVADGRGGFKRQRAPVFDLGTVPAGNLFTTADDLARFVSMLAAEGRARDGATILRPETLREMFTPQLIEGTNGFGLGFSIGSFQGRQSVGHNGAVYGFSSSLTFLPAEKIGVVVLGNDDIVNARIQKLANLALSLMLEAKFGEPIPAAAPTIQLSPEDLASFAGDYESQSYWARLSMKEGQLAGDISSQPTQFRAIEPLRFLADSAMHNGAPAVFQRDSSGAIAGFSLGGQDYKRVAPNSASIPKAWEKLLGSYGPSFIPLVISERHGHLYAMTENMVDYRLTPVNEYVFEFPPGMYVNEYLVFFPNSRGRPSALSLGGMILKRR